jgi:hypothetical protein
MQRPTLEIYFDEKETYHKCEVNKTKKLGIFIQVMVKNSGQIDAKKCTAELMNVEKQNIDGNFYRVKSFLGPVSLKWSHVEDYTERDIDCKYPRKLDVLFTLENDDKLYIYTKEFPSGVKTVFSPGVYKIEIRVSADNLEKSTYGEFVIYWDGNWENIRMDQYSKTKESPLLKKEYKENIPKIQSEVNILKPRKGEILLNGQKYIFEWKVSDSIKEKIKHFNLLLLIDDGKPEYMDNNGEHSGYLPADSRNWEWIVNANPTNNAKVRLVAMLVDKENRVNESDNFIIYEKTCTEAPINHWRQQKEKREKLKTKLEEQKKANVEAEKHNESAINKKKKQINLEVLLKKYNTLRSLTPTNKGLAFEKILVELLNIYNMNPKLNLILPGEQIDFSFSFENQTYLGEARYREKKPTIEQIGGFQTKVTSKGGYPLGLFVSISGFTANVLNAYNSSKDKVIILMDGNDLLLILKGAITFPEALKSKKRALSEGQVFFPLNNINK